MTPEAFRAQIETTLFGPVNVTRAALPQMRAQRSGLVVTISSTAGIAAEGDFLTAYATSKFGVEGFMEALFPEVAPSAPSSSLRSRQTSHHPRSRTTPSAPRRPSRLGRA
jgi:NAD(P)-dependent dehydrogenase (short-subunit alcohol dehydrogenase family)